MKPSVLFDDLMKLHRPYIKYVQPLLNEYDLHSAQWLVLKDIAAHPNTTLVQISKRRSIEKPTTRKILKVLNEKNWLTIQTGEDKREKLLNLSSSGRLLHDTLAQRITELQMSLLNELYLSDQEVLAATKLIDEIYHILNKHLEHNQENKK